MRKLSMTVVAVALTISAPAMAQIKIGVSLATTGPAASLGIPEKNTIQLLPKEIAGKTIEWIILDDASDPTAARRNIEKLTTENNVDVIIGTSTTVTTLSTIEVAARTKTPQVSLAASVRLVQPMDDQRRWIFKMPYNDTLIAERTALSMKSAGVKTLAIISFNDALGEALEAEYTKAATRQGIKIVASEKYNATDTSVTAQAIKVMASRPDGVFIGASSTPAALPQIALRDRGYKGTIFQTTGVITNDFLRVGGKNVEGAILPGGPVIVVDQLPANHPSRAVGLEYKRLYEAANGAGSVSTLGANAYDAWLVVSNALPEAVKKAQPGTVEFRSALRDAIEATKDLHATHGIINMNPSDHAGFSIDAPVMLTIKDGKFVLAKD